MEYDLDTINVFIGRGGKMNSIRKGSLYSKLLNDNFAEYSRLANHRAKRRFAWERVIWPITKSGGKFYIRKDNDYEEDEWVEDNCEHVARTVMQALRDRNKASAIERATSSITSKPPPQARRGKKKVNADDEKATYPNTPTVPPPSPGPDNGRKTPNCLASLGLAVLLLQAV